MCLPAQAQDTAAEERDVGLIQGFLEDNLSAAGRTVRITGFDGALSSRATIEELTIADADGVWLTMRGAVLSWNRSALLRGRLEIEELAAQLIDIPRRPATTGPDTPTPEAQPLRLPELPVSIRIDRLNIARLSLGAPLLGQAADLRVTGRAALGDGQGTAALEISRTDGTPGQFVLNTTLNDNRNTLALELALREGPDGIAVNLLGLPGRPSLDLEVGGTGPLADYTADIRLATDGQTRVAGTVTTVLRAPDNAPVSRRFEVNIGGDLRPLVQSQYRAFVGADMRLRAAGETMIDGGLLLERFTLKSDELILAGSARTRADGWPQQVTVTGRIAPAEGGDVLLALPGEETRLTSADVRFRYDATDGEAWTLDLAFADLVREGVEIGRARVEGRGALSPTDKRVAGTLRLDISDLALEDPALARAVGPTLAGGLDFSYEQGKPLLLESIDVTGDGYGLSGLASLEGLEGQLELAISGAIRLQADDLSRYRDIAGLPLGGAANLSLRGTVLPVSGGFDLTIDGTGRDLTTGVGPLDAQLVGQTDLSIIAARGREGVRLTRLSIDGSAARVGASGTLASGNSDLNFAAQVSDLGRSLPQLPGAATVTGTTTQRGSVWSAAAEATGPGDTTATFQVSVPITEGEPGRITGTLGAQVGSLSAYAGLAGRPISGSLSMTATGGYTPADASFTLNAEAQGQRLRSGIEPLDRVLSTSARVKVNLTRDAAGVLSIETFGLDTPVLDADVTGSHGPDATALRYDVTLQDTGILVAGLGGPSSARGTARSGGGPITLDTAITGPGGIDATLRGDVARDGSRGDLSINGVLPLALANIYSAPNLADGIARLDLALVGPLAPQSLSGTVSTRDARLTLPALGNSLTDIAADIRLSGGSAQLDARGTVASGGQLTLRGSAGLAAPFAANLNADLQGVRIVEPGLFETIADGRLTISGPLTGGGSIGGRIALGRAELRIPSGVEGLDGALPGLVHVAEPADVRRTRLFAGLIGDQRTGSTGVGGGGPAFALDLLVVSPNQVFVRGRGLDAELGGQLRLTGTTRDIVPQGQFDLVRGRLDLLGKRIVLTEARAQLQGDFVPYIRIIAETRSDDALITIRLEGPASGPEFSLSSDPDRPDDEVLAELLFNKNIAEISPFQALQLANAIRTLAGRSGEGIVGRLRNELGVDDLDFTTSEEGVAGLRIGKYLADNLYSDVTVNTEGETEVNLNLTITPSLTARGSVASDGETGLGIYFERDY